MAKALAAEPNTATEPRPRTGHYGEAFTFKPASDLFSKARVIRHQQHRARVVSTGVLGVQ
jgi:hypothetical protein